MPCTVGRPPNSKVSVHNNTATASSINLSCFDPLTCGDASKVIFPIRSFENSLNSLHLSNLHSVSLGKFASNNSCKFLGIHQIPKDNYFSKFSVDHARKTISKNSFIRFIDSNTDSDTKIALETLDTI